MAYLSIDALVIPKWIGTQQQQNNNYVPNTATTLSSNSSSLSKATSSTTNSSDSISSSNSKEYNNKEYFNNNNIYSFNTPLSERKTISFEEMSSISDLSVDNFKLIPIQKLREKFEQWLLLTYGDFKGRNLIQKLLFLDEFYDPKALRTRKLLNNEEIFNSLERFLNLLFQSESERIFKLISSKHLITDFPYLYLFEQLLSQQIINIPIILKKHEALNNLLKNKSQLLQSLNEQFIITLPIIEEETLNNYTTDFTTTNTDNSHNNDNNNNYHNNNYCDIQLIVNMFTTILSYHFSIFQQFNIKFINSWINKELENCPNYLIENCKLRIYKFNKYYQNKNEKLKDKDFNCRFIIDKDFELTSFLTEFYTTTTSSNTSGKSGENGGNGDGWRLSKKFDLKTLQQSNFLTVWKSKLNCTTIDNMKSVKIVNVLNCSLENIVKVVTTNSFAEKAVDSTESCSLQEFKPIQTNNSLQKYATAIHTCLFNFGPLFRKRSVENVTTLKCNFIGNELYSVSNLYKTCCHVLKVNNDEPLKIISYGVRTYIKIDKQKTLFIDVSLTNLKGMLNKIMPLLLTSGSNKFVSANREIMEKAIEEKRKEGFPKPNDEKDYLWMILKNYYETYCKHVDNDLFK
ncbi:hypothetical protein ABK040_004964 [Willaertia magna]